jgi:hypothetical protein
MGSVDRARGLALEQSLAALLYGGAEGARDPRFAALDRDELDEAARGVRRMVLGRTHRGSGGPTDWFPRTIAVWRAAHPEDEALDELAARFCASPHCAAWRELAAEAPGISLEEALYRFLDEADVGDAAEREDELLAAIARALAVTPRARFAWPALFRRAPGGCFALSRLDRLHAALDGRYVCGPVTPLVAAILRGDPVDGAEPVREALRALRLID